MPPCHWHPSSKTHPDDMSETSGSEYFNYKGFQSVAHLALENTNYKFIWYDVAASGCSSDSQNFLSTSFLSDVLLCCLCIASTSAQVASRVFAKLSHSVSLSGLLDLVSCSRRLLCFFFGGIFDILNTL